MGFRRHWLYHLSYTHISGPSVRAVKRLCGFRFATALLTCAATARLSVRSTVLSDLPSLELGTVCPAGHAWLFPHCQPPITEDLLIPPKEQGGQRRAAGCGPASMLPPGRAPAWLPVCPGRHASVPFPHCHRASRGWAVCPAVMRLFRIATGRMLRPVKRETGARRGSTGTIRRMTTVHHRGHGSCSRMISRRDKHRSLSFSRHPLFLIGIGHVAPSCRTN